MASDSESKEQQEMKLAGMSRNYFCVDCKCATRNPRLYLEHRRDFHKESISIYSCELCIYASRHSQKLARHLRTVHRDVVQNISVQPNVQINHPFEPDDFQSLQSSRHSRLSTCKLCGLYTVNKTVLMEHVRTQHPDVRIYKCDQCDYSHYIRDRYNRHHRYHSMNQIRCKMCEFQTIYRWNLERHMRHHIDTISLGFRCNKCNFTASTKQSITAHEIAHHSGLHLSDITTDAGESNEVPTIPRPILQEQIKLEPLTLDDDMDCDKIAADEVSEMDASSFLEVVLADETPLKKTEWTFQQPTILAEPPSETPEHPLNKIHVFHCINCHFRNEVDWHAAKGVTESPIFGAIYKPETQNSRYRCGFCHQTSNWKHVIERHCRLVHNVPAFIEKYSAEEDLFQNYIPTNRRVDLTTFNKTPRDNIQHMSSTSASLQDDLINMQIDQNRIPLSLD